MNQQFDLVVIGAGSGGYAAARTARDAGATVAFVDRGPLGGLCILRGCMPSKTLIATGDTAYEIRHAADVGVHAGEPTVDFPAVMARKREIIQGFADYRVAGIETFPTFHGQAVFESPHRVRVGDDVLEAKAFVIATGSIIMPPVFPGLEETGYIESDEALELEAPPKSLIVLGGGYVGSELGQFYARIGVPTTIIIRSGQLLTSEDADIGEGLAEYFREEGIGVEARALVQRVSRRDDGMKVVTYVQDGVEKTLAAHEIFYALGRVPAIEGLNLEAAGVKYHAVTGIEIDDTMRTSEQHIFVGDVTGQFALVHIAIQQGEIAGRNAVHGGRERADYSLSKTHTVFSDPQVAVVGESEKELQAAGTPYMVASYPFNDHGKAISIGKTKGFVKMMADPADGRILGAAVLGQNGSDLIHEVIVAMFYRSTVFDFIKIPHLHPTLAEIWTYPAEELVEKILAEQAARGGTMSFDVAIVQFKPRKGDVAANLATLRGVFEQLIAGPASLPNLIVLPEAALTGYFLEGGVYQLSFTADDFAAKLDAEWRAAGGTAAIDIVCGFYENNDGTYYNSALYATIGGAVAHVVHVHRKLFLPTYGVFDEQRFLSRGRSLDVFRTTFGTAAILICEDAWHSIAPTIAALKGARMIIIPSASPGRGLAGSGMMESVERWRATATLMASEHGVYVLYAGLTGFEGGKGMSGSSCIVSPRGEIIESLDELSVAILRASLDGAEVDLARASLPLLGDLASVLPDLWYDEALPLPRNEVRDAAGR